MAAGADMILIATSSFVVELADNPRDRDVSIMFILFFTLLWVLTLIIASEFNPLINYWPTFSEIRGYVAAGIGLSTLILASQLLLAFRSRSAGENDRRGS